MCFNVDMTISKAEQRQIENEMIFRRHNEKVGSDLDALDEMHREDGNDHLVWDEDLLLKFMCECSDENCEVRISLQLSEYQKIHVDRDTFIIKTDHQVDPIEVVISKNDGYDVVMKNNSTPEPNDTLKDTSVDNS